jgi:type I restriction enzyme S subunit
VLENESILLAPLNEQARIVAAIDELFARLDAAEASAETAYAATKHYDASFLLRSLIGENSGEWRRKNQSTLQGTALRVQILGTRAAAAARSGNRAMSRNVISPDVDGVPDIPDTWTWMSIDELSSGNAGCLIDGPFGSNLKTSHYSDSGARVIRLENIGAGVFKDAATYVPLEHFEKLKKHQIRGGDIVIASLGTPAPRACIIPQDIGKAIIKSDCIKLEPTRLLAAPLWIMLCLNSPYMRKIAERFIHGVGRPRLSLKFIRRLPIPVPPVEEQRYILDHLSASAESVSMLLECIETGRESARTLRQSILAAAFRGELVPQDPKDEPASVLLDRIRAQRAASAAAPKARKTAPPASAKRKRA